MLTYSIEVDFSYSTCLARLTEWGEFTSMEVRNFTRNSLVIIENVLERWIYVLRDAREELIMELHKSGYKSNLLIANLCQHYIWPKVKEDVKRHINNCSACDSLWPAKSLTPLIGLPTNLTNISPMDWVCMDFASIQDKNNGKKLDYLIIVDHCSGYICARKMARTKTKHLMVILTTFSRTFSGAPYILSSDQCHH